MTLLPLIVVINTLASRDQNVKKKPGGASCFCHVAYAAPRVADCHAGLQVVDCVCDESDEDEEDEDDEEDDDVALHFGRFAGLCEC